MKKQLSADPLFWMLLEYEARTNNTTSSHIARTAILSWICRVHQTSIPNIFQEERLLDELQKSIEHYHRDLNKMEKDKLPSEIFNADMKVVMRDVQAYLYTAYDKERQKLLNKRTKLAIASKQPL